MRQPRRTRIFLNCHRRRIENVRLEIDGFRVNPRDGARHWRLLSISGILLEVSLGLLLLLLVSSLGMMFMRHREKKATRATSSANDSRRNNRDSESHVPAP